MAMLLDGPPSTIDDLSLRDSDLLNVSVTESIDLTAKLKLAANEMEMHVESMLQSSRGAHGMARNVFPGIRNIAVTGELKLWHTYLTLRLIYQDLYYSRLNDRYQAKMNLFSQEESNALDNLRTTGLGIVLDPLPQASAPSVTTVQTSDAGGAMYVAVSLVNRREEEGIISVPIEVDTQDNSAASLTATVLPDNAVGWNLYAGVSPDALTKQNTDTLDRLARITVAPGRLSSGMKTGNGQHANLLYPVPRRILRG